MIELRDLNAHYGKVHVLRGVNLNVQPGEAVALLGRNGVGKTTTIGKLAQQFRAEGKSVFMAAGDTFRAAAVEQLQIWADRTGAQFVSGNHGADAAGLAFGALEQAKAAGSLDSLLPASNAMMAQIAESVSSGQFLYTKFFAVGIFRMLELAGLKEPAHLQSVVKAIGVPLERVNADLVMACR